MILSYLITEFEFSRQCRDACPAPVHQAVINRMFFMKVNIPTKSSRCYDGYPKIVAGRRVLNIGELQCDPNAASKGSAAAAATAGQSVTHGLLVVLILTVLAVGALVIYYHRKRMHDKLKPLVESLQKSMQYKTIEREDEQPEISV